MPTLGTAGEKSVRVTWEDATGSAPDIVVCAPCGYPLETAAELAQEVVPRFPSVPVWAVDANASFARPGPRLVDGVEALAHRPRERGSGGLELGPGGHGATMPDGGRGVEQDVERDQAALRGRHLRGPSALRDHVGACPTACAS